MNASGRCVNLPSLKCAWKSAVTVFPGTFADDRSTAWKPGRRPGRLTDAQRFCSQQGPPGSALPMACLSTARFLRNERRRPNGHLASPRPTVLSSPSRRSTASTLVERSLGRSVEAEHQLERACRIGGNPVRLFACRRLRTQVDVHRPVCVLLPNTNGILDDLRAGLRPWRFGSP
jgi:hypothetical protein